MNVLRYRYQVCRGFQWRRTNPLEAPGVHAKLDQRIIPSIMPQETCFSADNSDPELGYGHLEDVADGKYFMIMGPFFCGMRNE